ncbi:MAG: iron-sulfur cluster assembly scaffold protein [Pseudomonadota bacterium]|nr:iron-sulfur cluster assembly scaffold protein [Pseudomonadota bacterium]
MIDAIYNKDVLRLAANITSIQTIENADASASLRSPLCGSSIEISISIKNNRITGYSQKIKACALGQASASVMSKAVIGKSRKEIQNARKTVAEMLTQGTVLPEGDWAELSALAPAKDAKSRHGAILLPFDALLKALD